MLGRPTQLALSLAVAACADRGATAPSPAPRPFDAGSTARAVDSAIRCNVLPFAESAPIAEASGAVWIPGTGKQPASILLVGDSGTLGAYVRIDADTGAVLDQGELHLDSKASDDLEGLARIGDRYHAITSSGFVRHWEITAGKLELTASAYAVGSHRDDMSCKDGRKINCGPNYEGLCLDAAAAPGSDECVGFAASKTTGAMVCLTLDAEDRLRADASRQIAVSRPETLTGCDIADPEVAWAGTNLIGASAVYRIQGWRDPATAKVELVGALGPGFPEAMAIAPGGILYRFSDTGGAPSLMKKYRCE